MLLYYIVLGGGGGGGGGTKSAMTMVHLTSQSVGWWKIAIRNAGFVTHHTSIAVSLAAACLNSLSYFREAATEYSEKSWQIIVWYFSSSSAVLGAQSGPKWRRRCSRLPASYQGRRLHGICSTFPFYLPPASEEGSPRGGGGGGGGGGEDCVTTCSFRWV